MIEALPTRIQWKHEHPFPVAARGNSLNRYIPTMNKFLYFLIGCLLLPQLSFGQNIEPALAATLQFKLDSLKAAQNFRGVSASVIFPGQGMWQGVSGLSHAGAPITADMEFGIGSNTKLFTAVTLLKLVENGLISLEDSLHEWLPIYPNIDSNITIRQILNHVSGIRDITQMPGYPDSILTDPNRIFSTEELMTWVGAPLFDAGTGWNYSNTNYILAGMIIKSATGQAFGKILRDSILSPLQLDSTFLDVEEPILGTIAHPWQNGNDINNIPRVSLNSASNAAGAMYSSSGEMAQWYQKLMGGQILSSNALKQMTTFVGAGNYGFGISRQNIGGRTCFAHGGSIRGYRSFILYDTTAKYIVCVLINSNPAEPHLVAQELLLTLAHFPVSATQNPSLENRVEAFPNPSGSSFRLVFPENRRPDFPLSVALSDLTGRVVFSQMMENDAALIEIGHLSKGLFVIRAGNFVGKVVHAF